MRVNAIRNKLGELVCRNILFLHAFLGYDTTSRLFGIGKAAGLKLVKQNETFREVAKVFRSIKSTKDQVITAGEIIVQKGKPTEHLDTMRYQRFQELVTTRKKAIHSNQHVSTSVHRYEVPQPQSLPSGSTVAAEQFTG